MPVTLYEPERQINLLIYHIYGSCNYALEDCVSLSNEESGNILNYACCYHLYDAVEYLVDYKTPIFQSKYVKDPLSILVSNYSQIYNDLQFVKISSNSIELDLIYHKKLTERLSSVERLIQDVMIPYYLEYLTSDIAKEYMKKSIENVTDSLSIKNYIVTEIAFLENDDLYILADDGIY